MSTHITPYALAELIEEAENIDAVIEAEKRDPFGSDARLMQLIGRRERLPHLIEAARHRIAETERRVALLDATIAEGQPALAEAQRVNAEYEQAAAVYAAAHARSSVLYGTLYKTDRRLNLERAQLLDQLR